MDFLQKTIRLMDRKEVKHYKVFASRSSGLSDRKDIRLFDYIRACGEQFSEQEAYALLYGEGDKNSFYRLKNRLAEDLNKSIFLHQYQQHQDMYCLFLLAMGYYFFHKNDFELAYQYLRKAEKQALELEHFSLLDIIYSRLIKVSQETGTANPEVYIRQRKVNRERQNKISELEDILEALEYRLKKTQHYAQQVPLLQLLEKTIDEYTMDEELKSSAKLQMDIYILISRRLLHEKDFPSLEEYLLTTYQNFLNRNIFSRTHHHLRLQMLSWICNVTFKNKKYQLSLEYAEKLKEAMEMYDGFLYEQYRVYYINALIINFSVINLDKAIDVLEDLIKKENIDKMPYYGLFVYANQGIFYFQKAQYKKAMAALNKLYRHTDYKKADASLQLRINIGELMIRYEQRETELAEYRLKQIRKDFKEFTEDTSLQKEMEFLALYEALLSMPLRKDKQLRQSVQKYLGRFQEAFANEDILFKYHEWLAGKAR